jgi:hypothetical protein
MLKAKDSKGNKVEIKYAYSGERPEQWLVTFTFKNGSAQTYWALDEQAAKRMVLQVLGKVDWEMKD